MVGVLLLLALARRRRPGPGADVAVLARRHEALLPEDELRQALVRDLLHHQGLDQGDLRVQLVIHKDVINLFNARIMYVHRSRNRE